MTAQSTTGPNDSQVVIYVDEYGVVVPLPDGELADSAVRQVHQHIDISLEGDVPFHRVGDDTLSDDDVIVPVPTIIDIEVTAVDVTSTYTATLAGDAYNYPATGGDDEGDILDGIKSAIDTADDGYVTTRRTHGSTELLRIEHATPYTVAVGATNSGALSYAVKAERGDMALEPGVVESWWAQRSSTGYAGGEREAASKNTKIALKCRAGESATVRMRPSHDVTRPSNGEVHWEDA